MRVETGRLKDSLAESERELQAHREQLGAAQKELLAQKEAQEAVVETNSRLRERLSRLEVRSCHPCRLPLFMDLKL